MGSPREERWLRTTLVGGVEAVPRKNARPARSVLDSLALQSPAARAEQDTALAERSAAAPLSAGAYALEAEWLEADGLGGFASGSVGMVRTRRDQALLQVTTAAPPGHRFTLVNGIDAWIETPGGTFPLTSQRYVPGIVHPDGARWIESFSPEPWPQWSFALEDGTRLEHAIFARHERPLVALAWRLLERRDNVRLFVRPFISGRDARALHRENDTFHFAPEPRGRCLRFSTYPGVPDIYLMSNAEYTHAPEWYRSFLYTGERENGSDAVEDLAAPGVLVWDLSALVAVLVLASREDAFEGHLRARGAFRALRAVESARRRHDRSALHRSAGAYLVRHQRGRALVSGYPAGSERVDDTFGALRGLCVASGNLEAAQDILLDWSEAVSQGMLPNRLPAPGETPAFDSVEGSLWYVVAVHEFLQALSRARRALPHELENRLWEAVQAILAGYAAGTRLGIRADADGLLSVGESSSQVGGMPANKEASPRRIGKPVEVQALWLNALWIGGRVAERWQRLFERGVVSFRQRFWDSENRCLLDVIDLDHVSGRVDNLPGPYQIYAVGGLPLGLLEPGPARLVVDAVETRFVTPLGLWAPVPAEPEDDAGEADGVAQQDSAPLHPAVWPRLAGAFVEAWVRVRGETHQAKAEARERFLDALVQHLNEGGIGHVSECADAQPPHALRGSPFHAWSLGELLRLQEVVLAARKDALSGAKPEAPKDMRVSAPMDSVPDSGQ